MIERNDGGSAFPVPPDARRTDIPAGGGMDGMSLRDWFAGQTLARGGTPHHPGHGYSDELAQWCYEVADAMLNARGGSVNAP